MKVAIVGSRQYKALGRVRDFVAALPEDSEVVSGGAGGVDITAENAAKTRRLRVTIFKPDWSSIGKHAGILRNTDIINYADNVVAFWDGTSKGTLDSISKAIRTGKPLRIIFENGREMRTVDE